MPAETMVVLKTIKKDSIRRKKSEDFLSKRLKIVLQNRGLTKRKTNNVVSFNAMCHIRFMTGIISHVSLVV